MTPDIKENTSHQKPVSFEFFPPKTEEGFQKLRKVREELAWLRPDYFSVSNREGEGASPHDDPQRGRR